MAKVMPGRYTAQIDEPFVVFLIGMRINKLFAFSKWIPTARAMIPICVLTDKYEWQDMYANAEQYAQSERQLV